MTVLTPRQILDRLVKFQTVSRDSNLELVDWLEDYLTGQGVKCFRHWNEDRQKAAAERLEQIRSSMRSGSADPEKS